MRRLRFLAVGMLVLGLLSCGGGPKIGMKSPGRAFKDVQAGVARHGGDREEVDLARVESLLAKAAKLSHGQKEKAVGHYLEGAEEARRAGGPGGEAYFAHAVGQASALVQELGAWTDGRSFPGEGRSYRVVLDVKGRGVFDPRQFDVLVPVDRLKVERLGEEARQDGLGAPMVAEREWTEARKLQNHFLHSGGSDTAVTMWAEFGAEGVVTCRCLNPRKQHQLSVDGTRRDVAANYTAPIATTVLEQRWGNWGLKGVLSPESFLDKIGLYSLEEPDPERIPVIMAHGLLSKPETWTAVYNSLLADRRIRENYQFYFFYYPSGLPPMYPGAGLRRELEELQAHLKSRGGGRNIERMVLIGHSMGGLMVSAQVRDFRGAWNKMFVCPLSEASLSPVARQAVLTLFETAPPRYVTRAVFVATPHRGSTLANNWMGRIGSALSRVPESFMSLQAPELVGSMTDFGRSVLLTADPLDGIYRLREGNPVLKLTENRPISRWVTLHSIIGDEGRGDTPESTDGIVPYRSSHLEGVDSEKIVPSGHSAHLHPEGKAEIRRILLLHLQG